LGQDATAAAQTATDAGVLPHGLCGVIPSEAGSGGTGDWVCQAFGHAMPAVVFLVSITVISVTCFFLARYLTRCRLLMDETRRLRKELEKHPAPVRGPWATRETGDTVVSALARSGRAIPPLAEAAERLKAALLPLDGAEASQIVLRQSASELAGARELDTWTGKALADALPGWLTAIGLMTTFIAILLGLQNLRVLSNLEVRGIAGLINGLSGKFFSSITALGCAIAVSMINYALTRAVDEQWGPLQRRLETLLPHLTPERILLEMLRKPKG
jgi:hypothetical protein